MLGVPGTKTTASAAKVPIVADLLHELRLHRERQAFLGFERVKPEALVFQTSRSRPQSRRNALRAVHAAGDAAGLNAGGVEKIGLHDLRHSCAGILLVRGTPLPKVAAILRHASPRVTMTVYGGLVESEREALRDDLAAAFRH